MNDRQQKIIAASKRDACYSWWCPLWRITKFLLIAYLCLLLLAMLFEERLIFFPSKHPAGDWQPWGLAFEDAEFTATDGTSLHGWYLPHENPLAHVLFLHGNAGNITHRSETLRILREQIGVAVLILDYRGYGKSTGSPNEQGVLQDARAARSWLAERANIKEADIVLMGRSLGGGVAVDLTRDVKPRALVLESTFTTMPDVAAGHYPFLPAQLVMKTRLNSAKLIANYKGPLLQSHGTSDEVIPFALGRRLHEACPSANKRFIPIDRGGHNDFQPAEYHNELRIFLESLSPVRS